jgi:hypothetical protein
MLVDVVPLRRQGERLSNDEAKAAQPARGHVVLKTRHAISQFSETVRVVSATFEPYQGTSRCVNSIASSSRRSRATR